jgi:uncharacterized protein YyaL (SSP411 family)
MNSRPVNRLIFEKSPYLLQHAYNPVDWHPWGSEAFEKAKKEDKPVFLSIGYSTCHWCHVMERESFEDHDVAQLLNGTFVCIKVDREERPDIDQIYMRVCQVMTGSGGWPLTLLLLPDKRPFFAATYIPRESRFGRVGMKELIPRIKEWWETRRDELYRTAEQNLSFLKRGETNCVDQVEKLDETTLDAAYLSLLDTYDDQYGGFGRTSKFPSPHRLIFLLHYWKRTGQEKALRMVEQTLDAIQLGGINDHVGFGFHRYSTDRRWLLPHFEKMLYDQAMLTIAYVHAYQATRKKEFKDAACKTLTYVLRDMTSPAGAFYSAEDADVEGEEGEFYLWTEDEIRRLLPKKEADFTIRLFNITHDGNFEEESTKRTTGKNILYLKQSLRSIANNKIPLKELEGCWVTIRGQLFARRENRKHPSKDDKILTDWNGLMIAALAKASRFFNEAQYERAAIGAVQFIVENMRDSKRQLYHRYREGEAAIPAFLPDYSFFIWGLLELYETTFDVTYLHLAISLNEDMIRLFWDDKEGGFYFTADTDENILVRTKEIYDGAYPSGNSVAAVNLLRLARITGNAELEAKAALLLQTFSHSVSQAPVAYTFLMIALDFAIGPFYEVVVVGDPTKEDTNNMLNLLKRIFIPNKVLLFRPSHVEYPKIARYAEFTRNLSSKGGKATVYVCRNYECSLPTTSIEEMLQLLDATG